MQARMSPFVRLWFKFRILSFELIFSATTIAFSRNVFLRANFSSVSVFDARTPLFLQRKKHYELYDRRIGKYRNIRTFVKVSSLRKTPLIFVVILCVTLENCMHDCTHERIEKEEKKNKLESRFPIVFSFIL